MKHKLYKELLSSIKALIEGVNSPISNYANVSAAIFDALPNVNWAGFYFLKENKLILGPFQGKPACVQIPLGKGVCGTAMSKAQTLIVPNVYIFPGHIACDSSSRSEIVIPIVKDGIKIGVLDIDSPKINCFNEIDQHYLENIVNLLFD